jgi:putative ABC transport system permease protein
MIIEYVLKNMVVKPGRFLFLVLSVAIGVAAVVGILGINVSMNDRIVDEIDKFGANMLIYPESDAFSLNYGGIQVGSVKVENTALSLEDAEKILTIKNNENIRAISPKLVTALDYQGDLLAAVGVNFENELEIKKWWDIHGSVPTGQNEVLLGYELSTKLDKKPGDTLLLSGGEYKITGTLNQTGSDDDKVVFMGLEEVQQTTGKINEISMIEVKALCNTCPIEEMIRQISEKLPHVNAVALKQVLASEMSMMQNFTQFASAIAIFILVLSIISVFSTVSSSVSERTKEVGVLRNIVCGNLCRFCRLHSRQYVVDVFRVIFGKCAGWVYFCDTTLGPISRNPGFCSFQCLPCIES